MEIITMLIDFILHLDKYLNVIIQNYGTWTYLLLFLIIFCETGLVVTPFLPGDSILFAAGALAASGSLNIVTLLVLFLSAAILGDTVNYYIGNKIGSSILDKGTVKFINKEYLVKAQDFYEKHGSMTIVIGRFMPIIRTFVPFVAGIGKMKYRNFLTYNILGALLWIGIMLGGGFFFGGLPFIEEHFSYVVIAIIVISALPALFTFIKERGKSGKDDDDNAVAES